jgi:predicted amidohydrolase YtcJ
MRLPLPKAVAAALSLTARLTARLTACLTVLVLLSGCPAATDSDSALSKTEQTQAEEGQTLLLLGGRVYSFSWSEPALDGTPAADAPVASGRWRPDSEALLIEDGEIVWLGSNQEAESKRNQAGTVIELDGATVLPGLVDSHTHIQGLGAKLRRVDLVGVTTVDEVLARLASERGNVPAGEWIVGWGWDDGAWAANYPNWDALSQAFPDNPVALHSLHSFALWGNRAAFEIAGIDRDTQGPVGGEIVKDGSGEPTGILLNRATGLLTEAIPAPTGEQLQADLEAGLREMERSGYVSIHEAGLDTETLAAFRALDQQGALPLRVYAMLSARDRALLERYIEQGPDCAPGAMLRVCSVKAFWDGALGSRGARLLADYSDRPGHRGVSGEGYGFDQEIVRRAMIAGFQVGVHAIGDAGNRETLDFLSNVIEQHPATRELRHRIEHAQVVHPDDFDRFSELGLIASMQPPHMAEDKSWAEQRLGAERARGAYAWRTLRQKGAGLIFSSDLAGSDHDFFYGLHSAVTRKSPDGTPDGGWFPEQAMTVEEAVRAYSTWAAEAAFLEAHTGVLAPGRFADLTVIDIDPFETAARDPSALLDGTILLTVVGGNIVYDGR